MSLICSAEHYTTFCPIILTTYLTLSDKGNGGSDNWDNTLFFLYKNKVYKNVEPQLVSKTKQILNAEMELKIQLFLIFYVSLKSGFVFLK